MLVDGLGPAHRPARIGEDLAGHLATCASSSLGWHHVVDQPELGGARRAEHLAGHQQFLGAREADQLRPDQRAAVARDQPHLHMRIADHGACRPPPRRRTAARWWPQAGRRAVEPAQDRLLQVEQRAHDALGLRGDRAEALRLARCAPGTTRCRRPRRRRGPRRSARSGRCPGRPAHPGNTRDSSWCIAASTAFTGLVAVSVTVRMRPSR